MSSLDRWVGALSFGVLVVNCSRTPLESDDWEPDEDTGGTRATGGRAGGGTGGYAYGGKAGMRTGGAWSGGRPTGGRPTGGRPTGGYWSGGRPTGGRPTGGSWSGGRPTGGTWSGGRPTGGSYTGGKAYGGYPYGGGYTGGRGYGGYPSGGAYTGGRASGGIATGGVGGVYTGGVYTGGRASGGMPTGGVYTGGVYTGGVFTGGRASGGMPTGGAYTGGVPTGGVPTGGVPTGGVPTGGVPTGGVPTGGVPTGGVPTGGVGTGGCPPALGPNEELIDDMNDGDQYILQLSGRAGVWTDEHDATPGATMWPDPSGPFQMAPTGDACHGYAVHVYGGQFVDPAVDESFGFALGGFYNASAYTALSFSLMNATGQAIPLHIVFPDKDTLPDYGICSMVEGSPNLCWNHFGVRHAYPSSTTWGRYTIRFSDLAQDPGWGYQAPAFDPATLHDVRFILPSGAAFDVWVDDVTFVR